MKYLFLDLHGVLLPFTYESAMKNLKQKYPDFEIEDDFGYYYSPACVEALKEIVDSVPNLQIVISSNARKHRTLKAIQKMWRDRGYDGKIIDVTPILDGERGDEIKKWLEDKNCDCYAILDDRVDFDESQPLFHVDFKLGLTQRLAREVVTHLIT
jgi:HAD domain in Swiss Army Knife RNA repair proteins